MQWIQNISTFHFLKCYNKKNYFLVIFLFWDTHVYLFFQRHMQLYSHLFCKGTYTRPVFFWSFFFNHTNSLYRRLTQDVLAVNALLFVWDRNQVTRWDNTKAYKNDISASIWLLKWWYKMVSAYLNKFHTFRSFYKIPVSIEAVLCAFNLLCIKLHYVQYIRHGPPCPLGIIIHTNDVHWNAMNYKKTTNVARKPP